MFAFPDNFAVVLHVGVAFSADNQHHGIFVQRQFFHQALTLRVIMNRCENAQTDSAEFTGDDARVVALRITQHAHT